MENTIIVRRDAESSSQPRIWKPDDFLSAYATQRSASGPGTEELPCGLDFSEVDRLLQGAIYAHKAKGNLTFTPADGGTNIVTFSRARNYYPDLRGIELITTSVLEFLSNACLAPPETDKFDVAPIERWDVNVLVAKGSPPSPPDVFVD